MENWASVLLQVGMGYQQIKNLLAQARHKEELCRT